MKTQLSQSIVIAIAGLAFIAPLRSQTPNVGSLQAPVGGGGGIAQSGDGSIVVNSSVGGESFGGIATTVGAQSNAGYIGQLYDVVGLEVGAVPNTVGEGGARQLEAQALLDDESILALAPSVISWSIDSGPLSNIDANGLATADRVHQDTSAVVIGDYADVAADFSLTVLNINDDDFGFYAGDGLNDAWQVFHFGEDNPDAGPLQDPDGDWQNNQFEEIAGVDPIDSDSYFQTFLESVAGEPNQMNVVFTPVHVDRTYTVLEKVHLDDETWSILNGPTTTENQHRAVTDEEAGVRNFYQVRIARP